MTEKMTFEEWKEQILPEDTKGMIDAGILDMIKEHSGMDVMAEVDKILEEEYERYSKEEDDMM